MQKLGWTDIDRLLAISATLFRLVTQVTIEEIVATDLTGCQCSTKSILPNISTEEICYLSPDRKWAIWEKKILLLKWNVNKIQDLMFFNSCWLFDHSNIALMEYYILNIQYRSTEQKLNKSPGQQVKQKDPYKYTLHIYIYIYLNELGRFINHPKHISVLHIFVKRKKKNVSNENYHLCKLSNKSHYSNSLLCMQII